MKREASPAPPTSTIVEYVILRADLLDRLQDELADGTVRLLLLTGEAGVGKSHLLGVLADDLAAHRMWGTPALAHVPGSSLAHLVAETESAPELVRAALATLKPVLCADDLDLCDPLSRAVVERLLRDPDRLVLASVRSSAGRLPETVAHLAATAHTRVVEIPPLTRHESDQWTRQHLDRQRPDRSNETSIVDEAVQEEVWRRTRGNPLYAEQLLRTARSAGALSLSAGRWHRTAAFPTPPSLRAAVLDRVAGLSPKARSAAEWLAGVGEATIRRTWDAGHADGADELLATGLVTVTDRPHRSATDPLPTLAFAHPLHAEAVWEQTGAVRRHQVLVDHFTAERASPSPDRVRMASLGLAVGEPVGSDALLQAARLAAGSTDTETALALALAGLPAATGEVRTEIAALAADAMMQVGRAPEAAELLRRELAATRPGPKAILLAGLLHIVLTWGCSDEEAAAQALAAEAARYPRWTPLVKEIFGLIRADGLTYAGKPREALELAEGLRVQGRWPVLAAVTPLGKLLPQVEARIAQSRAHALTQLGRPQEAVAQLTDGRTSARLAELEELVPSWRGSYDTILSHAAHEAGDPQRAVLHATRAFTATLETGFVWGRAWAASTLSGAHHALGNLELAVHWAEQAADLARAGNLPDCEQIALVTLSTIHGAQGRLPSPDRLARLEHLPAGVGFLRHQHPVGAAWRAHAQGQTALAESLLADAAVAATRDGAIGALWLICHEWLRQGHHPALVTRLEATLSGAPDPLPRARLEMARGIQHRDPHLLALAAAEFAAHQMPLYAAECLAAAASLGTGREAVGWHRQADEASAALGSPRTVLLRLLDGAGAIDPLTRRERLIAELALTTSNHGIAEQLFITVKTVETHLTRVYMKLGITSRSDLAQALRHEK